jgi:predicted amidohydrolase
MNARKAIETARSIAAPRTLSSQTSLLLCSGVGPNAKDSKNHREGQVYAFVPVFPHGGKHEGGYKPQERSHVGAHGVESTALRSPLVRIGACQPPEIIGDIDGSIACIAAFAGERSDVDLLLFPECFLQGYRVEPRHLRDNAIDLASPAFQDVLARLSGVQPTLVFGLIEQVGTKYYNTAFVVSRAVLECSYRKTHLTTGERLFEPGRDYRTFEVGGIGCGINICYDTNFTAAARAVASQGARVLLVPSQNMMRREDAEVWKHNHNAVRAERVRETGLWLASADVTGARDDTHVAYGPTSIMNPDTDVIAQVPLMAVGMVVATINCW